MLRERSVRNDKWCLHGHESRRRLRHAKRRYFCMIWTLGENTGIINNMYFLYNNLFT